MELFADPCVHLGRSCAAHKLAHRGDVFRRMRKIEDPHRIRPMVIDKALFPFSPIHHGPNRSGLFHASMVGFHQSQAGKHLGTYFARKIGQVARMYHPVALFLHRRLEFANHEGAHLCPFPVRQGRASSLHPHSVEVCRRRSGRRAFPALNGPLPLFADRHRRPRYIAG